MSWVYDRLKDFERFAYEHSDFRIGEFSAVQAAELMLMTYKITTVQVADVHVVRGQQHNLDELFRQAANYREQFQDGINTLRQQWQGPHASMYLPLVYPQYAEGTVHDNSIAAVSQSNFEQILSSFTHNRDVHESWANNYQEMLSVQGEVNSTLMTIAGSQFITVALQAVPVVDALAALADVLGLAWLLKKLKDLWDRWNVLIKLIAVVVAIAAGTYLIYDVTNLVIAAVVAQQAISIPTTAQASKAQELWNDFIKSLSEWLTKAAIAYLICHYGYKASRAYLDLMARIAIGTLVISKPSKEDVSWYNLFVRLGNPLDSWAENMIHAIMMVGPQNVRDISKAIVDTNGNDLGDVDLVVGDPPNQKYIEVGGPAKGSEKNLEKNIKKIWPKEVLNAKAHGATAQIYLQCPPRGSSAYPQYKNAVEAARNIFGPQNVIEMPPVEELCPAD
jgi:hypothetical protein